MKYEDVKVGMKVVLAHTNQEGFNDGWQNHWTGNGGMQSNVGKTFTVSGVGLDGVYFEEEEEGRCRYGYPWQYLVPAEEYVSDETCCAAHVEQKQTAETLAPLLWNAYKDVLNEEALTALRDVIENQDWDETHFNDDSLLDTAFLFDSTPQGKEYWWDVYNGKYGKEFEQEYSIKGVKPEYKEEVVKIKSTGGSSDYYKLTIHTATGETFQCEVGDIIQAMVGDNFQLGNVLKASRRMWLNSQGGGKEGVDMNYDAAKIRYFTDDFVQRYGSKQ